MLRLSAWPIGLRFLFAACLFAWAAGSAAAQQSRILPKQVPLVQADLIADVDGVRAGTPFWVGIRLRMKERWHTYWRNPGDSGMATDVAWTLPDGYTAGPIVWPTPNRIPVTHLVNFGYEGETVLLAQITPPRDLGTRTSDTLQAAVSWLVCEHECIPGDAKLSLTLPVESGPGGGPSIVTQAAFDAAHAAIPRASPWTAKAALTDDAVTLSVAASGLKADGIRSAFYFPHSGTLLEHAAPQPVKITPDGLTLELKRGVLGGNEKPDLSGVLVIEEALGGTSTARQAFEIAQVETTGAPASTTAVPASLSSILQAAFFALLGGIVLNLMPCVFPVLSLKVLGLMQHAGEPPARMRLHGLVYTAGVLASFLVLAGILLGVRAAGAQVGWGFQLQSPVVVAILAYVLFALGLSLSGVFFVGGSVVGAGTSLMQRDGLGGSFFAGVLATVVATPCTAPFMGAAVGFALTQPSAASLIVFLALGLGLALPFLVLTFAPKLLGWLPRPGPWMETLKQVLAFPLYATVAWLMWVLSQQVDASSLLVAMIGLVLVAFAAWAYHQSVTAARPMASRIGIAAACIALLGTVAGLTMLGQGGGTNRVASASASAASAEPFTQKRLDALRAENRPVFVNMTAAWCITCLVNEKAALSTDAVKAAFAQKGIAYLKGDWTNQNPEITSVLERHGRSGVPLYLLYSSASEPEVLPQILTPGTVLEYLDKISDTPPRGAIVSPPSKEKAS
jgi:thiol:disulfide interchange protein DsbD